MQTSKSSSLIKLHSLYSYTTKISIKILFISTNTKVNPYLFKLSNWSNKRRIE